MDKLKCVIERVVFRNEENGYSVFQVSVDGGFVYHTITGTFQGVSVGATLVCEGEWQTTKYGRQLAVQKWYEELPATEKGIESYLASGCIKGIGKKTAKLIVKHFGKDTLNILDNNPDELFKVKGLGKDKVKRIKDSWGKNKEVREIMLFLQGHDISPAYAVKIYRQYGDKSIETVKENPYVLADDVTGIGFKMADQIARSFGYGLNDVRRCKAGILYTLSQLSNDGHCYAERSQLMATAKELLGSDEAAIEEGLGLLTFAFEVIEEDEKYFLPMYYYSELRIAEKMKLLLKSGSVSNKEVDIKAVSEKTQMDYDDIQADAIRQAMRSKVMVLTGLPGTGKTTTVQGIITALEMQDKVILCAAPTGRAAKRMSEATGKDAKTIHRLLGYMPDKGFTKNENDPLNGDVLIVDESSMIDVMLMHSLMKAIPEKMGLILVGDIDQLPSVGAGNVLRDVIDSGVVPVVRLTRIFRQALTSRIVTNAHLINKGEYPDVSNGKDTDFFFIKQEDAQLAANSIVDLIKNRIPNAYNYTIDDMQVLVPMKNGQAGTVSLNNALQEAVNPEGEYIQVGQYKFRSGDKVMQIKNDYDKNVFNGDVGTIDFIDTEERMLRVNFNDQAVVYESEDLSELTLAYATTIHKSQGSEYPVVVVPLLMSHYIMLQRNLVYTAVTRAKKLCIIVGDSRALGRAIKNMVVLKRNTMLKARLQND